MRDMTAEGFKCYESSMGGAGVLWHDGGVPLSLKPPSRSQEEGEGEVERDQDGAKKRRSVGSARGISRLFSGLKEQGPMTTVTMATVTVAAASFGVGLLASTRRGSCY